MGDGKIHKSIQYSVWCYSCDNLLDYSEFDSKADAEAFYRCQGWRKTKNGWQCDRCIKQAVLSGKVQ